VDTFEDDVFEDFNKKKRRIASKVTGSKVTMPKITPAKLKSQMYKVVSKYNSIYKDNSWENVTKMVNELERILPNLSVVEAKYGHDEYGVPCRKFWTYAGAIDNGKGKKYAVIADVTAHGAGSVDDPLDRYDITCVINVLSPKVVKNPNVLDYVEQYKIGEE
jgi:hypothetical protein